MENHHDRYLPKLVLSSSRDIPFNQLVLSQKNVRRLKAGLSIDDLADDIYHRTCSRASTSGRSSARMARKPACSKSPPAVAASARSNCW